MADTTKVIASAQIVANGGEITTERYVSAATDLVRGSLGYISAGTVLPHGAGNVASDVAPFDAAAEYVIILKSETDTGVFMPVQKINADTVLEGYVVDVTGDVVTMTTAKIGTVCEGFIDANGRLAVDVKETNGVFKIIDVMDNYDPYRNPDTDDSEEDSGGLRHDRVRFSIIASKLL